MKASGFRILVIKELSEQARSYRLLGVLAVFALFGLGSPLLAKLTPEILRMVGSSQGVSFAFPEPTASDAVAQFLKNMSQTVLLVLVILSSGTVVTEKDRGTAPFLLVKPVSRSAFILSKLLALWLTTILGMAISAAGCLLYAGVLFAAVDATAFARASLLLLAHMLVFVTTALLSSTVARSQVVAAALSFLVWVLLASLGMLGRFSDFLPGQLLKLAQLPPGAASLLEPLAGAAAIVLLCIGASVASFRRWEP